MASISYPFGKAFVAGSQGPFSMGPFAYNFAIKPSLPDGFVLFGEGGMTTVESMSIVPFCDALPGTLFSMRLFYWNRRGEDLDNCLWIGVPLIEVLCSVSNIAGPAYPLAGSLLHDASMRFCDQITLTAGNVGYSGEIYSFGAGSDLIADINCEIQGSRLVSFDFQAVDQQGNVIPGVTMNAYWAKFS